MLKVFVPLHEYMDTHPLRIENFFCCFSRVTPFMHEHVARKLFISLWMRLMSLATFNIYEHLDGEI